MRLADTGHVAFEALRRAPLRTAMMLLATAIGVAAVVLLTSLGEGARRYISGQFSSLGTHLLIVLPGKSETSGAGLIAGTTTRDLTLDDAEAIARNPRVAKVAPIVVGQAAVSFGGRERDINVMGSSATLLEIRHWTMSLGAFLPETDLDRMTPVCVIGREIRQGLFDSGNPLGQWMRLGDRRCRVIGTLGDTGTAGGWDVDDLVIMPVASAQALFNSPALFRILVETVSREAMEPAKEDIIELMKLRHRGEEDVTVISQDAVLDTFDSIFNAVTMALGGIAAISLIVAGVLIMNVMLVAVSQRTAEIGLFKALGARRRQIIALFLVEAATLASLGGLVGMLLGGAAVLGLRAAFPNLDFAPPLWAVAAALTIAVASGRGVRHSPGAPRRRPGSRGCTGRQMSRAAMSSWEIVRFAIHSIMWAIGCGAPSRRLGIAIGVAAVVLLDLHGRGPAPVHAHPVHPVRHQPHRHQPGQGHHLWYVARSLRQRAPLKHRRRQSAGEGALHHSLSARRPGQRVSGRRRPGTADLCLWRGPRFRYRLQIQCGHR